MDAQELNTEIRRVCSILESIAKTYPADSEESLAIRDAAAAYILVQQKKALKDAYSDLLRAFDGHISEKMKADMRRWGIEPDDFDTAEDNKS